MAELTGKFLKESGVRYVVVSQEAATVVTAEGHEWFRLQREPVALQMYCNRHGFPWVHIDHVCDIDGDVEYTLSANCQSAMIMWFEQLVSKYPASDGYRTYWTMTPKFKEGLWYASAVYNDTSA